MLKKIAAVISIPTLLGVIMLFGGFYGAQQGITDPILYVLFGLAIVFIIAGMVKSPKLVRKGAQVSTLWLSLSQKLFIVNSFLTLLYLLSPSLMEQLIFGVAFSTILTGIAFATVIASVMLLIDRYLV